MDGLRLRSPSISISSSIQFAKSLRIPTLTFPTIPFPNIPAPRLAPVNVPRDRRLQTFAVAIWGSFILIALSWFFFLCSMLSWWPILFPYLAWILLWDDAPNRGGRPLRLLRNSKFWSYFAGYFPVSLVKCEDLPANRKYIFGYHPHGIIGIGAIANFATNATGFESLFPGLQPRLLTLTTNFKIPFYRDFLLALGICSVGYKSCTTILRKGPGSCITIVVGGAAEALYARPGTADLTLKRRLGFIKLALREGADLVPCFSFGENDVYEQLQNSKGTKLYHLQKNFQAFFGFTLPVFHGRGLFNYSIGMMPYRHPIVTVIGKPIRVKQSIKPTKEELEDLQKRYIDELIRIWETYKDLYSSDRVKELQLVD